MLLIFLFLSIDFDSSSFATFICEIVGLESLIVVASVVLAVVVCYVGDLLKLFWYFAYVMFFFHGLNLRFSCYFSKEKNQNKKRRARKKKDIKERKIAHVLFVNCVFFTLFVEHLG